MHERLKIVRCTRALAFRTQGFQFGLNAAAARAIEARLIVDFSGGFATGACYAIALIDRAHTVALSTNCIHRPRGHGTLDSAPQKKRRMVEWLPP
jgi:hypothetical protein